MKTLKRAGKLVAGALWIIAGAAAGLNTKYELRKLWKRNRSKDDSDAGEETKVLY